MGIAVTATPVAGRWLADPDHWARLRNQLVEVVAKYAQAHPLETGAPTEVLRQALGLPDRALVEALVAPPLVASAGRIGATAAPDTLPPAVERAIARIRADLDSAPFQAPDADRLSALGLGSAEIGAAVRAGALFRIADGVVLLPGAVEEAARRPSRAAATIHTQRGPADAGHHPQGGRPVARTHGPPRGHPPAPRRPASTDPPTVSASRRRGSGHSYFVKSRRDVCTPGWAAI